VTDDQFDEFMALAKSAATNLRVEARDAGYQVETAGRGVTRAINYLTLVVILALVAYSLKG
jgi:hypothetical protein